LVARQLGVLFGAETARPRELIIQDRATEPLTVIEADHANGNARPNYRPIVLPSPWGERITLVGAEFASQFGGHLEGALAAAEAALGP
jgi:monoamine oxidase